MCCCHAGLLTGEAGIKAVLASDKTHFTLVLADGLAMFCERE